MASKPLKKKEKNRRKGQSFSDKTGIPRDLKTLKPVVGYYENKPPKEESTNLGVSIFDLGDCKAKFYDEEKDK